MIKSIVDDIYDITGIKAAIYDADMMAIYSHPLNMGSFCTEVRKHLSEKCLECDKYGFSECRRTGEICIYKCHMGLIEAVAPVYDDGIITGYIMFGQLLDENSRGEIEENVRKLKLDNSQKLLEELSKISSTDEKIITASARLMAMCASYVHLKNILRVRRESLHDHIARYVSVNLKDQELNVKNICKKFAISKGTLYNISKESFSMGISDYIRTQRIKKAIKLICEQGMPVYRASEEVGILDANYLTKLIKKETGKTPRQLKENKQ